MNSSVLEENGLVPVIAASAEATAHRDRWTPLAEVPLRLAVQVATLRLSIRSLLALAPGTLLETVHPETSDVSLGTVGSRIAWCEFETVGERIAVRLTRIA